MGDQSGRSFSFIGVLLLAAFGTFLWETIPLESARPPGVREVGYIKDYKNEVPAKLWQDPFKAIFVDGSIKKTLNEKDFSKIPSCDIYKIAPDFTKSTDQEFRILAAMVSMGSQAEIEERRRRRRYAVLSGLGQAGYVPEETTRIRFCKWKKEEATNTLDGYDMIVPYELFRYEDSRSNRRVLLLWLNESRFSDKPLGRFWSLVDQLIRVPDDLLKTDSVNKCHKNCTFFVLGPARSSTLKKLAERAEQECSGDHQGTCPFIQNIKESGIKGFHILSPTATAASNQLFPVGEYQENNSTMTALEKMRKLFSPANCTNEDGELVDFCVSFLRTIRTDDDLIKALVEELSMRGVDLENNKVALISEWDTFFGRSLPRSFEFEYCQPKPSNKKKNTESSCEVYRYSYLRGIDGHYSTYRSSNIQGAEGSVDSARDLLSKDDSNLIRRPAGTGQFDYLRRLAEKLEEVDREAKADNQKGIGAIGILGSDVYDKLLILRALRPYFPGVIFFTTDLDAQLLHPADFRWTRNLIIASSFNLSLKDKLQGTIPPFRENYQTSVFLSTLLATKYNYPNHHNEINFQSHDSFMDHIPVLLFEVGKHGAVQVNQLDRGDGGSTDVVLHKKPSAAGYPLTSIIALVLVAVILIVISHQLKPLPRHIVLFVLVLLFGLLILVMIAGHLHKTEETLSFIDGVSIWPTEFIRFISICLSVLIISGILSGKLLPDFEFPASPEECSPKKAVSVSAHSKVAPLLIGSFSELKKIPIYFYGLLAVLFLGLVGMGLTMIPVPTGGLLVYWAITIPLGLWIISVNTGSKAEMQLSEKTAWSVQVYLHKYNRLGDSKHRIFRSMKMWLLFLGMASLLFALTGLPHVPYRGFLTMIIDKVILIVSIFTMLFLIYLVIDAFCLCTNWIKGLPDSEIRWNGPELQQVCQEHRVNQLFGIEILKIRLIAKNTDNLCQLIYYPFLIIMLMLLSRSSYFDNWGLPQGIAIVVVINIFLLIGTARRLRQEAENCRNEAVDRLKIYLASLSGEEKKADAELKDGFNTTVKQAGLLIDEIRSIRSGAFQPFMEQPMVRASLILLGAIGLSVGEYLMLFR